MRRKVFATWGNGNDKKRYAVEGIRNVENGEGFEWASGGNEKIRHALKSVGIAKKRVAVCCYGIVQR